MSFNDTAATTTINIGGLIDTTATSTENVRSLLAGSVAWSYGTVEWFADATWTAAQITTLNTIFNTWGTVTGINFQQTTVQNDAEIILINDGNTNGFGGYSGIPADVPTTMNQTFTDGSVVVSQTGQINIHIAPGGFIGSGTTNINIFDAAGNITRGGFELIEVDGDHWFLNRNRELIGAKLAAITASALSRSDQTSPPEMSAIS